MSLLDPAMAYLRDRMKALAGCPTGAFHEATALRESSLYTQALLAELRDALAEAQAAQAEVERRQGLQQAWHAAEAIKAKARADQRGAEQSTMLDVLRKRLHAHEINLTEYRAACLAAGIKEATA